MEFGFFQQCLYPCLLQNVNTGTGIEVVYSLGCPYPTQIDPSRSMFASMFWDHMNYIPHLIMVWSPSSTSSEKNIRLFSRRCGLTNSLKGDAFVSHSWHDDAPAKWVSWYLMGFRMPWFHDHWFLFPWVEYSESTSGPMMLLSWDAKNFLGEPQLSWEIRFFHEHWLCRCSNSMERRLAYAKASTNTQHLQSIFCPGGSYYCADGTLKGLGVVVCHSVPWYLHTACSCSAGD